MILFWNIIGLNSIIKQKRLHEKIVSSKTSLVCLLETHVLKENLKRVIESVFPNYRTSITMHMLAQVGYGSFFLLTLGFMYLVVHLRPCVVMYLQRVLVNTFSYQLYMPPMRRLTGGLCGMS